MARETAMLRRQADALSKAPLLRDVILESDTSNVSLAAAWRGVATELVAPPWDPQLRVPATALDAAPPPDGVLQLPSGGPRSPLLPSLFMPGFPKAATTFLYECLLANFGPTQVGCGSSADGWDARSCGRRFALTTLNSDTYGRIGQWKETFFFGGKVEDRSELGGRDDLLGLHGPDPRRGALASLPALWAWDSRMRARDALGRFRTLCEDSPALPLACAATAANGNRSVALPEEGAPAAIDCGRPRCSVLGVAACEGNNFPYNRGGCSGQGTPRQQPVSKCTHPACIRIVENKGAWSGQYTTRCQWERGLKPKLHGATDSYCLHSMGPWGAPGELNLSVVDFTPNYLCDAKSIARLKRTAGASSAQLRFIVVMRDPIYRAFSEWSMFSLGWNWDPIKNFSASIATQVHKLRTCDPALFMQPRKLRALPTAQLAAYIDRCFGAGRAMAYIQTSMYSVCLLHALRHFRREQFLLLRYEDLMRMDADSVLALLARFTGLHPPTTRHRASRKTCQPGAAKGAARNSYSGTSPVGAEMLNEAAPLLEKLFAPYNALLRDLVAGGGGGGSAHEEEVEEGHHKRGGGGGRGGGDAASFGWSVRDHYKRPLNATRRAKREAELEGYREHLRVRQTRNLLNEKRRRNDNLAASGGKAKAKAKAKGGGGGGKGGGKGRGGGVGRGKGGVGKARGVVGRASQARGLVGAPSQLQLQRSEQRLARTSGKKAPAA